MDVAEQEAGLNLIAHQVVAVLEDEDEIDPDHGDVPDDVFVRARIGFVHVNVQGWRELEDPTFIQHFRMRKPVFEVLCVVIGNHLHQHGRLQRIRTPVDLMLLMGLWILANMDTFRATAAIFSVSRSVVHFHYIVCIEALRELAPHYIKWPTAVERDITKVHYETRFGYPGAVGAIDGTLVPITKPSVQSQRYVDRHHSYSLNVQAVCDHRYLIRDLYVGQAGSVHDARVFNRSPLSTSLLTRPELLDPDEHILGDGAYVLTDKVITPYRDNGAMSRRQRHHNYIHARCRSSIERTFGLLQGKFRRLKKFHVMRMDYAIDHIIGSCVLHNFIILDGEESNGLESEPILVPPHDPAAEDNEDVPADVPENNIMPAVRQQGQVKRNHIAQLLHPDNIR